MKNENAIIALVWLILSIVSGFLSNVFFREKLLSLKIPLDFFLSSTPGYLDYKYYIWCRYHNHSATPTIILRLLLLFNLIASTVYVLRILP